MSDLLESETYGSRKFVSDLSPVSKRDSLARDEPNVIFFELTLIVECIRIHLFVNYASKLISEETNGRENNSRRHIVIGFLVP